MDRAQKLFTALVVLTIVFHYTGFCQGKRIHTGDINNFWIAYDSVQSTTDQSKKIDFIRRLYIARGSAGLSKFIRERKFTASEWVSVIEKYPQFWESLRKETKSIFQSGVQFDSIFRNFSQLYRGFQQPSVYFTIGCLRSGGTTSSGVVLIGTEIAVAGPSVVSTELNAWLQKVFLHGQGLFYYLAHETVHTLQYGNGKTLLA
ncbi:MAG TPA: hypothetical protein VM012_14615, partial [Flavitalea sp.]|nr:hypothetical protein [Flavitalea sp.]